MRAMLVERHMCRAKPGSCDDSRMAISKCSCGASAFEVQELPVRTPSGDANRYRIMAIQCSACGLVVGTHEGVSLAHMLSEIGKKLGIQWYQAADFSLRASVAGAPVAPPERGSLLLGCWWRRPDADRGLAACGGA
jgi:hypothetical protein